MAGRAYRNKRGNDVADRVLRRVIPEDMPSPAAPIEEWRAWILAHEGPGAFSADVLDEMKDRTCAMPDCETRAVPRSLFCGYHQSTAVGEAGARELRQLNREMERMGRITDKEAQQHAVRKFRSRVASGDFAILFSGQLQETLERAAEDTQLTLELGGLRVAMVRAIEEIDDPKEMSMAISRIANAAARTSRVDLARRREKEGNGK